jgi:hypothetical protein
MPSLAEHTGTTATTTHPDDLARRILCRPACRSCMARQSIHGMVVRETPAHEAVCPRHQRWLLGDEQYHLAELPEVRRANRQHRRLTRRFEDPALDRHYLTARDRLLSWFQTEAQSDLQQRWTGRIRILGEDPYGDPLRPSPARIELATYPEAVNLTALLASAHWREHPELPREVARRFQIAAEEPVPMNLA